MRLFSHRALGALVFVIGTQFVATLGTAAGFDDRETLAGAKEVNVAFDITTGDAKALLGRLKVIEETRESLIAQGVTPHFILAFRGPATKLIQTDQSKIKPEDRPIAAPIATELQAMRKAPGIEDLQQCSVAVRKQGTLPQNVDPGVKLVGNAWISLMAYQNRGYAYIAP